MTMKTKTVAAGALALALGLGGCAGGGIGETWYLDTDGDPATPPVAVTVETRCATYGLTVDRLTAADRQPLSSAEESALGAAQFNQALAGCAVEPAPTS